MKNLSLPTNIFSDERIVAIAGEFGNTAQLVVIQLLCEIAAAGYFIEWNTLKQNYYARQFGIATPELCAIVNRLAEYGFFSKEMIEQDHVLTNEDVQRRYFRPRTRRRVITGIPHLIITLVQWIPEEPKAETTSAQTEAQPAPVQSSTDSQPVESAINEAPGQSNMSMGETVIPTPNETPTQISPSMDNANHRPWAETLNEMLEQQNRNPFGDNHPLIFDRYSTR